MYKSRISLKIARFAAALITAISGLAIVSFAAAPVANAVACHEPGIQGGYNAALVKPSTPWRSGPTNSCSANAWSGPKYSSMSVQCWHKNSKGVVWFLGYDSDRNAKSGWVQKSRLAPGTVPDRPKKHKCYK